MKMPDHELVEIWVGTELNYRSTSLQQVKVCPIMYTIPHCPAYLGISSYKPNSALYLTEVLTF